MSVVKEVFVGRKEEVGQFFEFLKRKDCPAFVVIGEPGIGKSSFMKEVVRRLAGDEKFVVGFYEVPFSADVTTPFVDVLEKLIDDLAARSKEQLRSVLKRIAKAIWNVAIKKGDRIARAFLKDLVNRLGLKYVVKELKDLIKEFDKTTTIYSLTSEFIKEHRSEFIYDLQDIFEEFVKEFSDKEFVLLIDQFERAPMPSCDVFLDFVRGRHENVHVAVALKVEEKGSERFNYVKPHLEQMGAKIMELPPLLVEEIGEWMHLCGKDFSYIELKKIWKLSAGFPFTISEWLKSPVKFDLHGLEIVKGEYCKFVKWRIDGLKDECKLLLPKLCVLLQPLSIEDYEKLTGFKAEQCSLFLRELKDNWIFDKYGDTFWFRHELIRFCIEQDLIESEKRKYHETAAQFFQQKYDEAKTANEKVDFDVGLGCAYHWHFAGKYKESLEYNWQFASFCFDTGSLDVAEDCYLRAMEDAEALGDEDSKMAAKGDLARVYHIWGRIDEAFRTHSEIFEYSKRKGHKFIEAASLHHLAMIEEDRGNYEKATILYNQSLEIHKKLGDQSNVAKSLHQLAIMEKNKGNSKRAIELCTQSIEIKEKLGDHSGRAKSLVVLANVHLMQGNYDDAKKYYIQSLEIGEKLEELSGRAEALHGLAMIERYLGNYEKATILYNQSLEIHKKLGDQSGMASTLHELANVYYLQENYGEAAKLYNQSLEIKKILGDQRGIALSYGQLGRLYESLNKPRIAADYFLRALNIFEKIGDKPNAAQAKAYYERVTKQMKQ